MYIQAEQKGLERPMNVTWNGEDSKYSIYQLIETYIF